jgi:hypothetical protein
VALRVLRHLDLALLALALPVFLAAGFPLAGWAAGTAIYLVQWVVRELIARRAARSKDPRAVVGLLAASMVGRGMSAGIALLVVGLTTSRHAGLAAALLFLAAFTVAFMIGMALRPLERSGP